MSRRERVMVGMSGGVDSSVAALLLAREGRQVEALFMKNWEEDDQAGYCHAAADLEDARRVCDHLGIPLHTVNFSAEYWDFVFTRFLDEYRAGRTPNPDIQCNQFIKFRAFLDHAASLGAERIATGHYVRTARRPDRIALLKGLDRNKDQSYFLYGLDQRQLSRSLFPLGALDKPRVRELARDAGLHVHDRPDSTGICFIGERPFRQFLQRYLPREPGDIVSTDGRTLGAHEGLMFYTLGQRQGLGIGGRAGAGGEPWYVAAKDHAGNRLIVAQGHDHPALYCTRVTAGECTWVRGSPPDAPLRCAARTRHRQREQDCVITAVRGDGCEAAFPVPQRAVTPGQSIVFYLGDECLGGGIIRETGE